MIGVVLETKTKVDCFFSYHIMPGECNKTARQLWTRQNDSIENKLKVLLWTVTELVGA